MKDCCQVGEGIGGAFGVEVVSILDDADKSLRYKIFAICIALKVVFRGESFSDQHRGLADQIRQRWIGLSRAITLAAFP